MASPGNPNTFTDNPLDRASHLRSDREWLQATRSDDASRFVALCALRPLVCSPDGAGAAISWLRPAQLAGHDLSGSVFLGRDDAHCYFALDVGTGDDAGQQAPLEKFGAFKDLLGLLPQLSPRDASLLAQAKSMVDWHQRHGFCSRCGAETAFADAGYRRDCPSCEAQHFPRTDPVVISLVVRGEACLLGRNAMFRGPMFSALAGFLEPGETVEEAVAREVMEEVGIEVHNIQYQFTQPWPFPSSLMIGCIAEALTETITLDEQEIAEARWFTRRELRDALDDSGDVDYQVLLRGDGECASGSFFVPPHTAIAHQLLQAWVAAT